MDIDLSFTICRSRDLSGVYLMYVLLLCLSLLLFVFIFGQELHLKYNSPVNLRDIDGTV